MGDGMLFDLLRIEPRNCKHRSCYQTHAYVPPGIMCAECEVLISQRYVAPDQPQRIGYVSAEYAWHYIDGKPWTTNQRGGEEI